MLLVFFFFKQKTAYEMRISDWSSDVCSSDLTPKIVAAIASCTAAIARLDARIMVSSVASAWRRRAAWMGYTGALQLQAIEIDEIDVFSWGCELKIANRAPRDSTVDVFEEFKIGRESCRERVWRDG